MLIAATAPVVNMAISNIPPNTSRESTITACTSLFNCINTCCRYSNDRFHLPLRHLLAGKNVGKGRRRVLSRLDSTINVNVTVAVSRRIRTSNGQHLHFAHARIARPACAMPLMSMPHAYRVGHDPLAHEIRDHKVTAITQQEDRTGCSYRHANRNTAEQRHNLDDNVQRHHRMCDAHDQRKHEEHRLLRQRTIS